MLYAILCYEAEDIGWWSSALDDAIMNDRARRESGVAIRGEIGPVVWLMPTTTALTIRSGRRRVVLDGPYAETKEQLLGLYVVDCDSLTEAIDTAMALAQGSGTMEIRPIRQFRDTGSAGEFASRLRRTSRSAHKRDAP